MQPTTEPSFDEGSVIPIKLDRRTAMIARQAIAKGYLDDISEVLYRMILIGRESILDDLDRQLQAEEVLQDDPNVLTSHPVEATDIFIKGLKE